VRLHRGGRISSLGCNRTVIYLWFVVATGYGVINSPASEHFGDTIACRLPCPWGTANELELAYLSLFALVTERPCKWLVLARSVQMAIDSRGKEVPDGSQ
jgi:hypothetical protein